LQKELKQLDELFTSNLSLLTPQLERDWVHLSQSMETLNALPTVRNHWNALAALSNFISRIILLEEMGLLPFVFRTVEEELSSLSLSLFQSITRLRETHCSTPGELI
jgi:hypothetical protein